MQHCEVSEVSLVPEPVPSSSSLKKKATIEATGIIYTVKVVTGTGLRSTWDVNQGFTSTDGDVVPTRSYAESMSCSENIRETVTVIVNRANLASCLRLLDEASQSSLSPFSGNFRWSRDGMWIWLMHSFQQGHLS